MNWNSTSFQDRVVLAIIKQPAKVPVTDPRYGGPILMNPGGPGYSGIYQVLSGGHYVQTIVDPHLDPDDGGEGKYFDVIGIDPRTVGHTTPHLTCFPDAVAESNWRGDGQSSFLYGASDFVFHREWARKDALGISCATQRGDKPNIAHFANTAQVVEDMVAIVERHADWREKKAKRLLSCREHAPDPVDRQAMFERTAWRRGNEKLSYWGFSYGTVLGQTFATMHPDRVHRLVLDGVVDAEDYYATG
ncbi:hypothetical protein BJ170DRAFT_695433 [Xylariales sp. AK1849]|nr:hypothetical protein BJ170DRAFT_695433 [Xylariales sp. AK1849]